MRACSVSSKPPISHWTAGRFCDGCLGGGAGSMSLGLRVLVLQSLCEPCHNSAKRQIELRGYRFDIGVEGYPTDPNHPFNRAR
jgi:hypothetical protein